MHKPRVSIIVPVYNAENHIESTIKSIQSQSIEDWELLLIDDGSTDHSLDIIKKYADADPRLRIFQQSNAGPSSARNLGIENVTSRYITFLDADDQAEPHYLKSLLDTAEKHPNAELVCAGYYEKSMYNRAGLALHDFEKSKPRTVISSSEFLDNLFNGLTGVLWAKLFMTEVVRSHNLKLPLQLKMSEDLVFVADYAKCIKEVAICYENIYIYNRLDEKGLSRKFDESYLDNFLLFNDLISRKFEGDSAVYNKLQQRTSNHLIKTLKDQNTSVRNLKYYHRMILKKMGTHALSHPSGLYDRTYIMMQNYGCYSLAYLQERLYQILKNFKHA